MKILIQKIDSSSQSTINCYLFNSSDYQFSADIKVDGFTASAINEKTHFLNPGEIKEFFRSFFHLMDHYPIISYSITPYSTMGPEKTIKGQVKVKGKDFVSKSKYLHILNGQALSYQIDRISITSKVDKAKLAFKKKDGIKKDLIRVKLYNTNELLDFDPTIDLHLHKLVDDVSKVKSGMALLIQIAAFEKHLEKAIRLGVDRVFVIHGVGEGKLKNAVMSIAENHPIVKKVKNEYHPKFGFGSTEIII